jgi:C1A family cysteine protease
MFQDSAIRCHSGRSWSSSDPTNAVKYYQRVLDHSNQAKQPDLFSYLKVHISELQAASSATEGIEQVSTEGVGWTIDYTQFVRAIRDGGQEGSVVGQALATAMEMQIKKVLRQDVSISARFIYNATRLVEGTASTDSGAQIRDAIGVLTKQGAVEESVWPYKAGEFAAKPPAAVEKAARWQIKDVKSLKGMDEIKKALADNGPVVAGIEVYQEAMSSQAAKTGVFPMPQKGSQIIGGHAIVLVAYDDQRKLFKFANDWGTGWGDRGYGYLSEEYLQKHSSDCWSFKSVVRSDKAGSKG